MVLNAVLSEQVRSSYSSSDDSTDAECTKHDTRADEAMPRQKAPDIDLSSTRTRALQAGTSRTPDGGLTDGAGRLEVLDAVLASCCTGAADPVTQLKASLEEAVSNAGYGEGSENAAAAGHYVRAAQKLSDKGKGYLFTELKRLEGMLGGGAAGSTISPQKRTLFMVRSNILRAFVEFGFGDVEAAAGSGEGGGVKTEL